MLVRRAPIEKQVRFGGRKRKSRKSRVKAQPNYLRRRPNRDPQKRQGGYSQELPAGLAVVRLIDGNYLAIQYTGDDLEATLWESPVTDDRYEARQWALQRWNDIKEG